MNTRYSDINLNFYAVAAETDKDVFDILYLSNDYANCERFIKSLYLTTNIRIIQLR